MEKQYSHEIAPQTIEAALRHAKIAQKHGEEIAAVGQKLQSREGAIANLGQVIREHGQSVQQLAWESQKYAQIAQANKSHSTEAYVRSAEAHSKAVGEHVAAVNEYLVATKEILQRQHTVPQTPGHVVSKAAEEDQRSQP